MYDTVKGSDWLGIVFIRRGHSSTLKYLYNACCLVFYTCDLLSRSLYFIYVSRSICMVFILFIFLLCCLRNIVILRDMQFLLLLYIQDFSSANSLTLNCLSSSLQVTRMPFNICVEKLQRQLLSLRTMAYRFPEPKKEKFINVLLVVKV